MDDQSRNLILATALCFLVILVWFFLFPPPPPPAPVPEAETAQDGTVAPPATGTQTTAPELAAPEAETREQALARSERVRIRTPRLEGSMSLVGGRIDDLKLTDYTVTVDRGSPEVTLLTPAGAAEAYYPLYG